MDGRFIPVPLKTSAVLIAVLALSIGEPLLASAWASAPGPKVENPHGAFKEDCSMCHSAKAWKPAEIGKKFDHEKYGGIPLSGAHSTVKCTRCHVSLDFSKTSGACVDCHADVHGGELGTDCAQCHGTKSFNDRSDQLNMHRLTRFPLAGAHQTLDCDLCHKASGPGSMVFVNTPTECESCHLQDYAATTAPNHESAGFSRDCQSCHNETAWSRVRFDHAATQFPLTGAHGALQCDACHEGNVFTGLPTACVSCHQSDFDGTTDPNHAAAQFSTDCEMCHTTASWQSANFNHSATNFPLTGAHVSTTCDQCHVGGVYTGLSTACVSCHQTDFDGTTDPNHAAARFPTDCEACHTTTRWQGASFNHSSTGFPLTGAHLAATCDQCHAGGVYTGLSGACVSCHQSDFDGTTDPNHVTAHFPTDCEQCHTTTRWDGATFNHSVTDFPLTGAHVTATCDQCHGGGVYTGLSTACVSCHQSEYNGTNDPNHAAAGFPTDCEPCHTTTRWTGATFNHDPWFPIYSGRHNGKWNQCEDCHPNAASYAVFDCLGCHPHDDKAGTDADHRGRSGYSYSSDRCYACHPDGRS